VLVLEINNKKFIYRIKFEKTGVMKFIGHLDLLKLFQRAVKRSGLPVVYSQGFNPHQIMSFALPLSVGVESLGEIVEIEFSNELDTTQAMERLNNAMPDELKAINMRKLKTGEKNAAASLTSASYELVFPQLVEEQKLAVVLKEILAEEQIIITKKSKKGEKEVDIRPMIYSLESNSLIVQITIATGSVANLKAEAVAEIICEKLGISYVPGDVTIKRTVLFGGNGEL
jgi:radical SAM-linked protein